MINGLSDGGHPVQVLTDLFTVEERWARVAGRRIAFVGDGVEQHGAVVGRGGAALRLRAALGAPQRLPPAASRPRRRPARRRGHRGSARGRAPAPTWSTPTCGPAWARRPRPRARLRRSRASRVDEALLAGAQARARSCCTACPAHRGEEIAAEVIDGPALARVFDEAENRMHVQKALLGARHPWRGPGRHRRLSRPRSRPGPGVHALVLDWPYAGPPWRCSWWMP